MKGEIPSRVWVGSSLVGWRLIKSSRVRRGLSLVCLFCLNVSTRPGPVLTSATAAAFRRLRARTGPTQGINLRPSGRCLRVRAAGTSLPWFLLLASLHLRLFPLLVRVWRHLRALHPSHDTCCGGSCSDVLSASPVANFSVGRTAEGRQYLAHTPW
jgi:hypothetical protein